MDKGEDSKEVVGLVERLREAIGDYQVSKNELAVSIPTHSGTDIATASHL